MRGSASQTRVIVSTPSQPGGIRISTKATANGRSAALAAAATPVFQGHLLPGVVQPGDARLRERGRHVRGAQPRFQRSAGRVEYAFKPIKFEYDVYVSFLIGTAAAAIGEITLFILGLIASPSTQDGPIGGGNPIGHTRVIKEQTARLSAIDQRDDFIQFCRPSRFRVIIGYAVEGFGGVSRRGRFGSNS